MFFQKPKNKGELLHMSPILGLRQESVWLDTSKARSDLSELLIVRMLNVGRCDWVICFGARWYSSASKWAEIERAERKRVWIVTATEILKFVGQFRFNSSLILSCGIYCKGPRRAGSLERKPGWKRLCWLCLASLPVLEVKRPPLQCS